MKITAKNNAVEAGTAIRAHWACGAYNVRYASIETAGSAIAKREADGRSRTAHRVQPGNRYGGDEYAVENTSEPRILPGRKKDDQHQQRDEEVRGFRPLEQAVDQFPVRAFVFQVIGHRCHLPRNYRKGQILATAGPVNTNKKTAKGSFVHLTEPSPSHKNVLDH